MSHGFSCFLRGLFCFVLNLDSALYCGSPLVYFFILDVSWFLSNIFSVVTSVATFNIWNV